MFVTLSKIIKCHFHVGNKLPLLNYLLIPTYGRPAMVCEKYSVGKHMTCIILVRNGPHFYTLSFGAG